MPLEGSTFNLARYLALNFPQTHSLNNIYSTCHSCL